MISGFTPTRCWSGIALALLVSAPAFAAKKYIEPIMVNIPAGEITLQSPMLLPPPAQSSHSNSEPMPPPQQVSIKPFRMGKYEVTLKEFGRFIAATHYQPPTQCMQMKDKQWFGLMPANWAKHSHSPGEYGPVTCIGWPAAEAYAQWLSKETGKHYRLPSEAEWEYAARAGTTSAYFWGDDPEQACHYANIADHSANEAVKRDYDGLEYAGAWTRQTCDDGTGYASIVGSYEANAFGLHDMIGNIGEFTADCYNPTVSENNADGSARTDGECDKRITRGGSWHWSPMALNMRGSMPADYLRASALLGFRLVEELDATHPCNLQDSSACKKLTNKNPFARELAKARKNHHKTATTKPQT